MQEEMIDSLLPSEMAKKAEQVGVAKANMPFAKTFMLSVLAGSFIALGAVFSTTVTAGSTLPFGVTKLLGGLVFSLGLVLVIAGGAELFTGNNLIIMAWANHKIKTIQVLKNWTLVYAGNLIGAFSMVALMYLSGQYAFGNGVVGANMLAIAKAKCELGFVQAVALGILCNILVCLAVWLSFSARSLTGKIAAIVYPITAFVAAGFEHSIANMYFIPMGILLKQQADADFWTRINNTAQNYTSLTWERFLTGNLLPVTIGNIIGGAVLVGLVYWFVFLKPQQQQQP
ncbi:formate transporter FocA [Sphingobacteriales bacterium UPWRP_1]|nr:formate transporter FocA [Sphingobacteriales bacterium TSM_CSM]PSJ78447.1 formate transporter FocA [Sphingobacteriales bacterium UPWRP_1]